MIVIVVSIKEWVGRLLFLIVFAALLVVVTGAYQWLLDAVSPVHPNREPQGDAVKVFVTDPASPEGNKAMDRLRWFYWYGQ